VGIRLMAMAALGCIAAMGAGSARAQVSDDAFLARTTGDIATLCAVKPTNASDMRGVAAVHFCQGFAVGAFQVLRQQQLAMRTQLFCPPETLPTRNAAIADFVQWAGQHPDQMQLTAAEGLLVYLEQKYPCPATGKKATR
jgi:hypothetical protein